MSDSVTAGQAEAPSTAEKPAGPAWMAQLPKDLQTHEGLTRFATIGDLGKAFVETEGKAKNAVIMPGDDAKPEERAAFYERLGRPKTADEYELSREIPAGLKADPEYDKAFRAAAHEAGLTKAQTKELYSKVSGKLTEGLVKGLESQAAAQKAQVAALKDEWGAGYADNVAKAQKAFSKLGSPELAKLMDDTGLGSNPVVLKAFRAIWDKVADDSFVDGDRPDSGKARDLAHRMYPNQA